MKQFSFLEKLSDAEIIEILEMNNLKLKFDAEQSLRREYDRDGEYIIVANCLRTRPWKKSNDLSYMNGALIRNVGGFSSNSSYVSDEIIAIRDFYMTEVLSYKKISYQPHYANKLTKNYQKYMAQKFGDQYIKKAEEYFKAIKSNKNNQNTLEK